MKMIDEKGRLFGKINIVDFLIIIFLIVIIPVFFHAYKILGKQPSIVPHQWIRVEAVTFTIPEFAELFKEGDASYGQDGNLDGKISKILKKPVDYSDRLKKVIEHKTGVSIYKYRIPVFLEFELLCTKSAKGEPWYYRRRPIFASLDEDITFDCSKYRLTCYIIKIKD